MGYILEKDTPRNWALCSVALLTLFICLFFSGGIALAGESGSDEVSEMPDPVAVVADGAMTRSGNGTFSTWSAITMQQRGLLT